MDLPILKHIDVLIGIAVVMLIASTVVTAATQMYLTARRARSLYLREKLEDLIAQLAPEMTGSEVGYLAERLLRHPMVGRRRWVPWFGRKGPAELPLPAVARGEVILRHEIVQTLLEWAAGDGPLARQDQELVREDAGRKARVEALRGKLYVALRRAGIADPAEAAREVRRQFMEYESANPAQASQVWHTQALVKAGLGDLTGKIFAWYDNSMERVTEFFSLEAKAAASAIALVLCFVVQLDSIDLLRRLSQDDKFRAAMAAQAEMANKQYEELVNSRAADPNAEARKDETHRKLRESVAALRDPKMSMVPDYLLWNEVEQVVVGGLAEPAGPMRVRVDRDAFPIAVEADCAKKFPICLVSAIGASHPPVEVYATGGKVALVARNTGVGYLALERQSSGGEWAELPAERSRAWDKLGFWRRFPGVLLSWVLLSLGAPFWYDLLKKLLGLRSLLQDKDDGERKARRQEQTTAPPVHSPPTTAAIPSALQGEAGGVILDHDAVLRTRPSMQAPVSRDLPAGHVVNVEGFVKAEAVRPSGGEKDRWYRTVEGDYLWEGNVKPPAT